MKNNGKIPFKDIVEKIYKRLSNNESPKDCIDVFNKAKNQLINHFAQIDKQMIDDFKRLKFFQFFNENGKLSNTILFYLMNENYEDLFAFIKMSKLLEIQENDDLKFLKNIILIKIDLKIKIKVINECYNYFNGNIEEFLNIINLTKDIKSKLEIIYEIIKIVNFESEKGKSFILKISLSFINIFELNQRLEIIDNIINKINENNDNSMNKYVFVNQLLFIKKINFLTQGNSFLEHIQFDEAIKTFNKYIEIRLNDSFNDFFKMDETIIKILKLNQDIKMKIIKIYIDKGNLFKDSHNFVKAKEMYNIGLDYCKNNSFTYECVNNNSNFIDLVKNIYEQHFSEAIFEEKIFEIQNLIFLIDIEEYSLGENFDFNIFIQKFEEIYNKMNEKINDDLYKKICIIFIHKFIILQFENNNNINEGKEFINNLKIKFKSNNFLRFFEILSNYLEILSLNPEVSYKNSDELIENFNEINLNIIDKFIQLQNYDKALKILDNFFNNNQDIEDHMILIEKKIQILFKKYQKEHYFLNDNELLFFLKYSNKKIVKNSLLELSNNGLFSEKILLEILKVLNKNINSNKQEIFSQIILNNLLLRKKYIILQKKEFINDLFKILETHNIKIQFNIIYCLLLINININQTVRIKEIIEDNILNEINILQTLNLFTLFLSKFNKIINIDKKIIDKLMNFIINSDDINIINKSIQSFLFVLSNKNNFEKINLNDFMNKLLNSQKIELILFGLKVIEYCISQKLIKLNILNIQIFETFLQNNNTNDTTNNINLIKYIFNKKQNPIERWITNISNHNFKNNEIKNVINSIFRLSNKQQLLNINDNKDNLNNNEDKENDLYYLANSKNAKLIEYMNHGIQLFGDENKDYYQFIDEKEFFYQIIEIEKYIYILENNNEINIETIICSIKKLQEKAVKGIFLTYGIYFLIKNKLQNEKNEILLKEYSILIRKIIENGQLLSKDIIDLIQENLLKLIQENNLDENKIIIIEELNFAMLKIIINGEYIPNDILNTIIKIFNYSLALDNNYKYYSITKICLLQMNYLINNENELPLDLIKQLLKIFIDKINDRENYSFDILYKIFKNKVLNNQDFLNDLLKLYFSEIDNKNNVYLIIKYSIEHLTDISQIENYLINIEDSILNKKNETDILKFCLLIPKRFLDGKGIINDFILFKKWEKTIKDNENMPISYFLLEIEDYLLHNDFTLKKNIISLLLLYIKEEDIRDLIIKLIQFKHEYFEYIDLGILINILNFNEDSNFTFIIEFLNSLPFSNIQFSQKNLKQLVEIFYKCKREENKNELIKIFKSIGTYQSIPNELKNIITFEDNNNFIENEISSEKFLDYLKSKSIYTNINDNSNHVKYLENNVDINNSNIKSNYIQIICNSILSGKEIKNELYKKFITNINIEDYINDEKINNLYNGKLTKDSFNLLFEKISTLLNSYKDKIDDFDIENKVKIILELFNDICNLIEFPKEIKQFLIEIIKPAKEVYKIDKISKQSIIILANIYSVKNNIKNDEIFNKLKSKVEKIDKYMEFKSQFDLYLSEKEIIYVFASSINNYEINKKISFDILSIPRNNLIKKFEEKLKFKINAEELEIIKNNIKEIEIECVFGIFDPQRDKILINLFFKYRNDFKELRQNIKYLKNYKKLFSKKGNIRKYNFDDNKFCLYMKNGDSQFCRIKNNIVSNKVIYYSLENESYSEKNISNIKL